MASRRPPAFICATIVRTMIEWLAKRKDNSVLMEAKREEKLVVGVVLVVYSDAKLLTSSSFFFLRFAKMLLGAAAAQQSPYAHNLLCTQSGCYIVVVQLRALC